MGRQLIKTTASQLAGRAAYLFGAGKIGRATLEHLRGIVDLQGILDNNKKELIAAGTVYPVSHPSAVRPPAADLFAGQGSETQLSAELRLQEAIVIVAVLDYEPVVQQLKALGWPESKIFISVSWKIPFADDPERSGYEALSFSEAEARRLLADSYSKTLYDFILENRGGSVNLYQYSQLSPIRGSHGYWEDAASTLSDNQNLKASAGQHPRAAGSQEPKDAAEQGFMAGGADTVEVTAIDQIQVLEKDLFIKMDIEGAEAAAIRGAERTIREKRPFLAVCAYHRPSDLFLLPALMKSLNPDYRIFLRGGLHYAYYAIDEAYL